MKQTSFTCWKKKQNIQQQVTERARFAQTTGFTVKEVTFLKNSLCGNVRAESGPACNYSTTSSRFSLTPMFVCGMRLHHLCVSSPK